MAFPRKLVVSVCALGLTAVACGGASEDGTGAEAAAAPSSPASNVTAARLLPTEVAALPDFAPAEYEALLGQLRGTPVVVNIWAAWCGPCRAEAPELSAAAREYGDRVQFLGVDILDQRDDARAFIDEFGWPYPSVFDAGGEIRDRLGVLGQPVTVFYGADGRIADVWNGPIDAETLRGNLEAIVG